MFNKRGQELSTGTIILLIIGVIILVLLALGFTSGWGDLGSFLGQNNVDAIVSKCNSACTENAIYDYCIVPRDLKSETEKINDATCYYLALNRAEYNIENCGISCSSLVYIQDSSSKTILTDTELAKKCEGDVKGKTFQYLFKKDEASKSSTLISYKCPEAEKNTAEEQSTATPTPTSTSTSTSTPTSK